MDKTAFICIYYSGILVRAKKKKIQGVLDKSTSYVNIVRDTFFIKKLQSIREQVKAILHSNGKK